MVLLAGHLMLAQLTLVLAAVFIIVGKATRWRMSWLAAPAVAGVFWTLAIGPRAAAAGFAAGPGQVLGHISQHGLLHATSAFSGIGSWLPRQLPLALIAAAGEAALAGWLDWLHTDEWAVSPARPGLLAAIRRAATTRAIRAGAVVTRTGGTLGVASATGARASLSWTEAAAGVLLAGAAGRDVTATSFQLVHAALRLRKPVIVVDLGGDPAVGGALETACSATGTPLRTFGAGAGCYEPFRDADPARRTELTLAMLGVTDANARGAETCLRTAFELMAAVPADPRTPVLDDVLHLLNPRAMRARLSLVPAESKLAGRLAEQVRAAARLAQADPEAVASVARELESIRNSPAGHWLRPGGAQAGIDLSRTILERSAALFRLGTRGMARLVCTDLLALGDDLRAIGVGGDAVVLLCGCEKLPDGTLARLVASGATAGLCVLATTTSATAAAELAGAVGALVIHRLADAGDSAAASLAARTGTRLAPAGGGTKLAPQPVVPVTTLHSLRNARFVLAVNAPRRRLVELAETVPARLPRLTELAPKTRSARAFRVRLPGLATRTGLAAQTQAQQQPQGETP
jgi:hypothetical protein